MEKEVKQNTLNNQDNNGLKGSMGVFALAMTALAFVAPLGGINSALPAYMTFCGSGTPLVTAIITALLLVFAVGFTKMGAVMTRPGGFYAYVSDGLGKKIGFSTAGASAIGYMLISCWAPPLFAIQCNNLLQSVFGMEPIPWVFWAVGITVLCTVFAYHRIDLSAKVMVYVMFIELVVVVIFDVLAFIKGFPMNGADAIPTGIVDNGKLGAGALMIIGAFYGFEATVIYREETKDPQKTMPRAVNVTLIWIGLFWVVSGAAYCAFYGSSNVEEIAINFAGTMFRDALTVLIGKVAVDVVTLFCLMSFFASQLSIHNVATRYWYSLGVDGVLPKVYGKAHPKHNSPYAAALTVGIVMCIMVIIFYFSNKDTPELVYPMFSGTGTFFVTINLFLVSLSIFAYFRKNRDSIDGLNPWNSTIAPILATIGLGIIVVLAIIHFEALLGSSGWATYAFMTFVVLVFVGCYGYAAYIEKKKPDLYIRLGRNNPDVG